MVRTNIAARLQQCGLDLHPEKTKLVYCKDANRKESHPTLLALWERQRGEGSPWEPYELRGSRTVLEEPRGEIPRGYALINLNG